jgi:hypothetical protein
MTANGGSLSEKMRLDSSGNLGLGVTPSAWQTGRKVVQVGISSLQSVEVNTVIGNNFYSDGASKYIGTGVAQLYAQEASGVHAWYTAPSGTAGDAISFTQSMTLDASGNLGVGETSPTTRLHVAFTSNSVDATLRVQQKGNNTAAGITLTANDNNGAGYNFIQSETTGGTAHWKISGGAATSTMAFSTGGTERARIDSSGNLLVGTTSYTPTPAQGVQLNNPSGEAFVAIGHVSSTPTGNFYASFNFNSATIGSITQSGTTAVLYNVTSDQRLKENIVDAPEFGSVIDSIKVRSYDWKTDQTHQRAGFSAQELVAVAPEAVHQPADPEKMMAVDYSKLVPMLVKEIQSLRARLAAANL